MCIMWLLCSGSRKKPALYFHPHAYRSWQWSFQPKWVDLMRLGQAFQVGHIICMVIPRYQGTDSTNKMQSISQEAQDEWIIELSFPPILTVHRKTCKKQIKIHVSTALDCVKVWPSSLWLQWHAVFSSHCLSASPKRGWQLLHIMTDRLLPPSGQM